jgi:hypothetical protein
MIYLRVSPPYLEKYIAGLSKLSVVIMGEVVGSGTAIDCVFPKSGSLKTSVYCFGSPKIITFGVEYRVGA